MRTKTLALCIYLAVLASPTMAADVAVPMNDDEQKAWVSVGAFFDRCTGALVVRSDASACKTLSEFLASMSAKVMLARQMAPPVAVPAAPPAPPPPAAPPAKNDPPGD